MELLEMPMARHYCLITEYGFSTFLIRDPHVFAVQDIPMRFLMNIAASDTSDIKTINDFNAFFDRFKNRSIKFFGYAALTGVVLKTMFKTYEKDLEIMIGLHSEEDQAAIIEKIRKAAGIAPDLPINFAHSPLFVFTRDNIPDL